MPPPERPSGGKKTSVRQVVATDMSSRVAALTRLGALHSGLVVAHEAHLDHLLVLSSKRFEPLEDPLTLHYGTHRWLREQREEAYSDWFAWVLEQAIDLPGIRHFFRMPSPPATVTIRREVRVDYRDTTARGRLDLLIEASDGAVCIVEIKVRRYVEAEVLKQDLYCASRSVPESASRLFVAVRDEGFDLRGFNFVSWNEVCLLLRRSIAEHGSHIGTTRSAMVLAFVGAVENNLLGLCAGESVTRATMVPTSAHLQEFLAMDADDA